MNWWIQVLNPKHILFSTLTLYKKKYPFSKRRESFNFSKEENYKNLDHNNENLIV